MIGDIIHEQGNYRETVVAEHGNLQVIDCTIDESTILLRVEAKGRLEDPFAFRLTYDASTIERILETVQVVENEKVFEPPRRR